MSSGRGNQSHVIHPIDDQHQIDLGLTDTGKPVVIVSYKESPNVSWVDIRIDKNSHATFFEDDQLIAEGVWPHIANEIIQKYVQDLVDGDKFEIYMALENAVESGTLTALQARSIRRHVENSLGVKLGDRNPVILSTENVLDLKAEERNFSPYCIWDIVDGGEIDGRGRLVKFSIENDKASIEVKIYEGASTPRTPVQLSYIVDEDGMIYKVTGDLLFDANVEISEGVPWLQELDPDVNFSYARIAAMQDQIIETIVGAAPKIKAVLADGAVFGEKSVELKVLIESLLLDQFGIDLNEVARDPATRTFEPSQRAVEASKALVLELSRP